MPNSCGEMAQFQLACLCNDDPHVNSAHGRSMDSICILDPIQSQCQGIFCSSFATDAHAAGGAWFDFSLPDELAKWLASLHPVSKVADVDKFLTGTRCVD
ncbi:hypothetical protein BCR44DRAFT_42121 [Catenaria anguillulae PL171]|uniref:Uncharacterized protein n=1 Tax=Catenaria anguillulae PL171 TaxID=765915 RepID=A0A1Y2H846_9FUNG|nr:hypothetical protein BCR44DRAFT_42121 [Catenaria anguillulae PL171]